MGWKPRYVHDTVISLVGLLDMLNRSYPLPNLSRGFHLSHAYRLPLTMAKFQLSRRAPVFAFSNNHFPVGE